MPTFILTAQRDIYRGGTGLNIEKGQHFTININMRGIGPNNLFNNSRCENALIQQFRNHGIVAPRTDAIFSRGPWKIEML